MSKAFTPHRATFPRVAPGARDRTTLEQLRQAGRVPDPPSAEYDYRGCVVQKPWGFEFLAYATPEVAVWRLRINAGHSTSMHCHPRKRTALLVLAGGALCHMFGKRFALQAHDVLLLEPGVFHATKATSADGLDLLEVETPCCKTDLVRLNDLYGRESAGYEGLREMQTDRLERFAHFALGAAPGEGAGYVDPQQRFALSIKRFDASRAQRWSVRPEARAMVLLSGEMRDPSGGAITVGHALTSGEAEGCALAGPATFVGLALDDPRAVAEIDPAFAALRTGTY